MHLHIQNQNKGYQYMDAVKEAMEIDYTIFIPTIVLTLIIVLLAVQFISKLLEWLFVEKLGIETKWGREKRREHNLLMETAESLNKLQEIHKRDMERSDRHDDEIKEELVNFTTELRQTLKSQNEKMNEFTENRIRDREQSREIQKELNASIVELTKGAQERKEQINRLMLGSMELLGDKIDQRFSKYVAMKGIPENEVAEFDALFFAYQNLNGNHGREQKYKYVKKYLSVLPVEINPIYDDKEN